MLEFWAFAACRPFHAEVLNERSSMPPMSVTIQATYFGAGVPPPGGVVLGFEPHAAAANVSPPTAIAATSRIPRAERKRVSPSHRPTTSPRWTQLDGSVRPLPVTPRSTVHGSATALPG